MSAELSDWIADLSASGPGSPPTAAAVEIAAALTAVLDAPDVLDLPAVTDLANPAEEHGDPREAVDDVYSELMNALALLRQHASDGPAAERQLQRCEQLVGQFRVTKETAKAQFTAAEAMHTAKAALDLADGDLLIDGNDGYEARRSAEGGDDDPPDANVSAAACELRRLVADGRRLAASILADGTGHLNGTSTDGNEAALPAGLLELRADPLGTDARLVLAEEPAGTITLLAVLEDADAVREHRAAAIGLAGDLLARIRASGWPAAGDPATAEVSFASSGAFLAAAFPLDAARVRERAAELATVASLRALREDAGLSIADVTGRTRIDAAAIRRLEAGQLREAPVGHLVAYVRAIGGQLGLTATKRDGGEPARLA